LTEVVDLAVIVGVGTHGIVKEVSVHGTICAAKEIHHAFMHKEIEVSFIKECKHCSKLLHPNIVQFLGIYYPSADAKLPWIIMERMYISLTGLLEKFSPKEISYFTKTCILSDVSLGLQYLHGENVVHRDISSNNILLTEHLVAKIGDLGVAKMINPNESTSVPGTYIFMPPEAFSVNPQYEKPVDVFSLGCVMIHMLNHQWPIPDDQVYTDPVTHGVKALNEIERRKKYLGNVPQSFPVKTLITNCLHSLPSKRPSIAGLYKEIEKLKDNFVKKGLEKRNILASDIFTLKVHTIYTWYSVNSRESQGLCFLQKPNSSSYITL